MGVVLECRQVRKSFGTVRALDGADLRVERGTIHGLVGENGAGKTTLMKVVMGEDSADAGTVDLAVRPGLVRQQLSTVPEFSVLDNIVFGAEPVRRGLIDRRRAAADITALMDQVQLSIPLRAEAALLPLALQQRMEILRVLYRRAGVILMDEPTALLTPNEVDALFSLLRRLAADGQSIVLITHKLREIEALCDAVTVIRHGRTVRRWDERPFSSTEIASAMVGVAEGDTAAHRPERDRAVPVDAPVLLSAGIGAGKVEVRGGEVLGVAGVAGNGQEHLVEQICGLAQHRHRGGVRIGGTVADRWSTRARRAAGLRMIPADVRQWGSAVTASIRDNVLTTEPAPALTGRFRIRPAAMRRYATRVVEDGGVVCAGIDQRAGELSGGNLQRLVVARELGSGGSVVLAHEPTRGVDFKAARIIRGRLRHFADDGGAVLLVSADLDELFEVSDRIVVLYRGAVVGELPRAQFSRARLGALMGGIEDEPAATETVA
ncbi:ABC transporter ATP-binding protein [Plantactinospora sp. GCM10030261]|uniref:ABC transporter ATP-binding protein n=1 Tax=Plantactinospora sp. GCM10030261 TaxID=3273420 RepID=UPI00360E85A2